MENTFEEKFKRLKIKAGYELKILKIGHFQRIYQITRS